MQFLSPHTMAIITIKNISKDPQGIRRNATAEKIILNPGETAECDRDWAEGNILAAYGNFFRAEGGSLPGLKDVLAFIEKATDAEKEAIAKALAPVPAKEAKKADKAPKA